MIIANGTNFPDALAGGAAAAANEIPILLTRRELLPAETTAQLNRLQPLHDLCARRHRVGVDRGRERAEGARQFADTVTRLAGDDRYETAVTISQQFFITPRLRAHVRRHRRDVP